MIEEFIKELPGTFRTAPVAETLYLAEGVLQAVGITRVANITGLDHLGIPTSMVVRPQAKSLSVSQGKGQSWDLAKASGMMEAIELYHAENLPAGTYLPLARALGSEEFVSLTDLPLRTDARIPKSGLVPWLSAVDLHTGKSFWVPRELCDLDSTPERQQSRLFRSSTVGLASGNTLLEAVMHGLLEAIEHDCVAFWQVRQLLGRDTKQSGVDLESINDLYCSRLVDQCLQEGLGLAVWDAAGDLGIPCFVATIYDKNGTSLFPESANGYGCHIAKHVALGRAITEAAQSRLTRISGVRDDLSWRHYRGTNSTHLSDGHSSTEAPASVDYHELVEGPKPYTTRQVLNWLLGRLRTAGIPRVFYVDLTDRLLGVPVAFTVVPQLEQPDTPERYVPGPRMSDFIKSLS